VGLEGAIYERSRPGAPPKITGEIEAQITVVACSAPPDGHAHWTLALITDKIVGLGLLESISTVAIHKRLNKMRSSPGAS
jgi:putative transposase